MTLDEIIAYVRKTPENTNPAVLASMIQEYAGEGGGGSAMIVNITTNEGFYVMDKTFKEIEAAFQKGLVIVNHIYEEASSTYIERSIVIDTAYSMYEGEASNILVIIGASGSGSMSFYVDSLDGYPYYQID